MYGDSSELLEYIQIPLSNWIWLHTSIQYSVPVYLILGYVRNSSSRSMIYYTTSEKPVKKRCNLTIVQHLYFLHS